MEASDSFPTIAGAGIVAQGGFDAPTDLGRSAILDTGRDSEWGDTAADAADAVVGCLANENRRENKIMHSEG